MKKSQPAGCTLVQNRPSRVDTPPAQVRISSVPAFAIHEEAWLEVAVGTPNADFASDFSFLHGQTQLSIWPTMWGILQEG